MIEEMAALVAGQRPGRLRTEKGDRFLAVYALFGGAGEFDERCSGVHTRLLEAARGDGSVRIIPLRFAEERLQAEDLRFFRRAGVPAIVVRVRSRMDADMQANADALVGASLIFMHGGLPAWIVDTLRDTKVWASIAEAVASGTALAATSGGMMALGGIVPAFAEDRSDYSWTSGLSLLPDLAIASHFDNDRFSYLRRPFLETPSKTVLAVDEATAAIGDGTAWIAEGTGSVHVIDGDRHLRYSRGESFRIVPRQQ